MSITPFVVLIGIMFLIIRIFGAGALNGASQMALLASSGLVIAIGMLIYGVPWDRIEESITHNIKDIGSSILILLLIGAIGGSWMVSGIVPTLICYGLKIISPKIFLFATCLICAIISLMTGSSWTTIATLGVALTAIGTTMGFSPGWTAGAIISGAYFGDKISPLSDTTVLASSTAGTPLFTHIKYMLITTTPTICIALVIYLIASLCHPLMSAEQTFEVEEALGSTFVISPWLLIVPVLTGIMIYKKVPAILTLLCASLMAGIAALIAQPSIVAEVAEMSYSGSLDFEAGFKGIMLMYTDSTAVSTGSEIIDQLVQTGGMNGMLPTIFLISCAAAFGGALNGCGMVKTITDALTKRVSSRTGLVSSTVGTGIFSNLVMGDQYLSIILSCRIFKGLYKKMGYEGRLLSRSVEDSATVTSVLIPWNSCGMTQSTVLRVPTLTYLPFCFFNIISPLMSIIVAMIGYKIFKVKETSDSATS